MRVPTLRGLLILALCVLAGRGVAAQQRDLRFEAALERARPMLSEAGWNDLLTTYIPHLEPCRSIRDDGGHPWVATYADGFRVGNWFRLCRGTAEVLEYFTGQAGGDCESHRMDTEGNLREQVCFPRQAASLVAEHGLIMSISIPEAYRH